MKNKVLAPCLLILGLAVFTTNGATAFVGGKEGGGDPPTELVGVYSDLTCRPAHAEENCPTVEILPSTDSHGRQRARGLITGGDEVSNYLIVVRSVVVGNEDQLLLRVLTSSGTFVGTWLYSPRLKQLKDTVSGRVLRRQP